MPDHGEKATKESFSNPLAPVNHHREEESGSNLTNEDFRKLMMTPSANRKNQKTNASGKQADGRPSLTDDPNEDAATRRRKKKLFFAKQHKLVEEREAELAKTYRDRAKERRETQGDEPFEEATTTGTTNDYRSVAPSMLKAGSYLSQHRKQLIQESKYLGGDMEHTHLVKGLDFALLEKVKAEIINKEEEETEQELEMLAEQAAEKAEATRNEEKKEIDIDTVQVQSTLAKNILTAVTRKLPLRNEMFSAGRMAYIVDLEDNTANEKDDSFDVPITLIRSKADCPNIELATTLTANDIIINKLTQILSYLRQGRKEGRKMKKKDKALGKERRIIVDEKVREIAEMDIYDDINKKGRDDTGRKRGHGEHKSRKHGGYFEKPKDEEHIVPAKKSAREMVASINDRFSSKIMSNESKQWAQVKNTSNINDLDKPVDKLKEKMKIDSYAECYPGMIESADAYGDSDEEADYLQMDQGHKKGPVGRWDFETHEEYSQYMSKKEQLPKAAFQFGVKMSDGRKTRRVNGSKDEKAHLDKEWQKIQTIIESRKG